MKSISSLTIRDGMFFFIFLKRGDWMINQDLSEFKKLGSNGKIVPISLEIEGDTETPITIFDKLCNKEDSYLLESVEGGSKWGRYSYIGRKPFMKITCYGQKAVIVKGEECFYSQGKALELVKHYMDDMGVVSKDNTLDFNGGAVGYIGYDVIRDYEKLEEMNDDDLQLPDVYLLFAEEVIVYDHTKQTIKIILNVQIDEDIEKCYRNGKERLYSIKEEIISKPLSFGESADNYSKNIFYQSSESKESYMKKVEKAKEYIKNGDIFQVVISQRLQIETKINPFETYRSLRRLNPSPYMYYFDFGDHHVVGSSPELLVKVKNGEIETCPIAGTRPRGKNELEDDEYAKELLNDEKELAEHLMLVDLARNDIGKVSEFGTVELSQFMDIQKYSHVMHIVSNVIGKLKSSFDMYYALKACMPAGTVSGAPKVRAMEIIDELENKKRGLYAGAVGYFGFNGNMDMCIAIRTILFKEDTAYIQAGAGIVADSDPEKEYEETLRKAEALLETIRQAKERKK